MPNEPDQRILLGVAMTLATGRDRFPQYEGTSRSDSYRDDRDVERNGYSYVRRLSEA